MIKAIKKLLKSPRMTVSLDGTMAYVVDDASGLHPKYWLQLEPTEGPVPEEHRGDGNFFSPMWFQVTVDGRTYHRKALPFVSWEVRSDPDKRNVKISRKSEFYKDFVAIHAH